MYHTKDARTTITISEDLLFELKKKALNDRKTLTQLINESISRYLGREYKGKKNIMLLFGSWGKGERGKRFLNRVRYGKNEIKRDTHLQSVWKKS